MEFDLKSALRTQSVHPSAEYAHLRSRFKSLGVTYLRQVLLRRIAVDAPLQDDDIEDNIQAISSILLLNPIELAYWEVLLHSTSLTERSLDVPMLYLYTAYLSKSSLNESVHVFEHELATRIHGFRMSYENWLLMTNCPSMPDLISVNLRFKQMLSSHHKFKDYDAMVNSLMVIPRRKDSLASEKSEGSTFSNPNIAQTDFNNYMGNEKLSPIDEY